MAIKKISQFTSGTPTKNDKILFEQNGAGKSATLIDIIYPVGSIYLSVNNVSPASFIGGEWNPIKDVFLLTAGDTYKATTNSKDGGSSSVSLTIRQLPSHSHRGIYALNNNGWALTQADGYGGKQHYDNVMSIDRTIRSDVSEGGFETRDSGSDEAHENMPPYKVVYAWKRIA